jgi:hypothetical protein
MRKTNRNVSEKMRILRAGVSRPVIFRAKVLTQTGKEKEMAKHRGFYLLAAAAVLGLVVIILAARPARSEDDFSFDAAQLKDTALWTRVNAEPYRISVAVDTLCGLPTTKDYEPERKKNPHAASFITVYVNDTGREAMFAKEIQPFPIGSVIVKEKIGTRSEGSKPLLYTVMRKREQGYNPSLGDWEFAVVSANGTEVQARGKLENCQSCHKQKPDSDFIFRPYLKSE